MSEPKLRFKRDDWTEYPAWEDLSFGSIYRKNIERNDKCEFPFSKTISIASMTFNKKGNGAEDASLTSYKVLRVGDIAFEGHTNKQFAFGRFVLNDIGDGIISPRFSCLRPQKELVTGFWKYYIHHEPIMRPILVRSTKMGTMMNELVFDDLAKQHIFVPCLEEQQKIASFLSDLDAIISASEAEVVALEQQKKGAMQKFFSQEMRFRRDDGTEYPEWKKNILSEVTERIIVGLATTVTPYYRDKGTPMFRNLNIRQGILDDSDLLFLDEQYADKQNSKFIHTGDILTVHTGNIGWSCIVPPKYDGALSFTTLITTVKFDIVDNIFLCHFLNSPIGMSRMQEKAFSGGRANLNVNEFQQILTPIPCLEEQQKIADFLSSFDEAIALARQEFEKWKLLKKGLMQQMFV